MEQPLDTAIEPDPIIEARKLLTESGFTGVYQHTKMAMLLGQVDEEKLEKLLAQQRLEQSKFDATGTLHYSPNEYFKKCKLYESEQDIIKNILGLVKAIKHDTQLREESNR